MKFISISILMAIMTSVANAECIVREPISDRPSPKATIAVENKGYSIKLTSRDPKDLRDYLFNLVGENEYAFVNTEERIELYHRENGKLVFIAIGEGTIIDSWAKIVAQLPNCPTPSKGD